MRSFNVFSDDDGRYRAVKRGWCWPAFFFGSIWALFSGLWLIAFLLLPIDLVFSVIGNNANGTFDLYYRNDETTRLLAMAVFSILLTPRVLLGIFGNSLRARKLRRMEFLHVGYVKADGKEHAISLWKAGANAEGSSSQAQRKTPPANASSTASSEGMKSAGESMAYSATLDEDLSHVTDSFLLIFAVIIGIAACASIIGLLPAGILLFGLAVSLKSGSTACLKTSTELISGFGKGLLVLSAVIGCLFFALFLRSGVDEPLYRGSFSFLPGNVLLFAFIIAALSWSSILALRYLWLNPLLRQFPAIRSFLFGGGYPDKFHGVHFRDLVSGKGLHWLWTASAAVLFLVLWSRGNNAAAIFIAISGLLAAPLLAAMLHRYGGSEKLRSQLCLGAAGLSCAAMLLFTTPSPSSGNSATEDKPGEPALLNANEIAADDLHTTNQQKFDANSQPTVTPSTISQSITGCMAIDGDTLKCGLENIRLLGIDAPEMPGHCRLERTCVQGDPFASKASLQNAINFDMNIIRVGIDRYNRTLGLVYANGENLSCIQLSRGHAAYIPDWDNGSRVANECSSGQF